MSRIFKRSASKSPVAEENDLQDNKASSAVIIITWCLRILVGAVFVISGFTKGIDPWGFIFKIEEYIGVWGMNIPRAIILAGAIGLSAYEFMFGVMLIMGAYKRSTPRALMLTMLFMLPLTAYIAIADPVDDCGCFGDWLKISNWATFGKNIFITAALIWLIKFNGKLRFNLLKPSLQWISAASCALYIIVIGLMGYLIQPLIDFRPYAVGKDLFDKSMDDDDTDLLAETIFVYEKDGITAEYTVDNLPDSSWVFIERHMPDVTDANSVTVDGFGVFAGDEEVSYLLEEAQQPLLLITIPEPRNVDISTIYTLNELSSIVSSAGGTTYGLISGGEEAIDIWSDISMANYELLTVEDTTLKSLVRGNPGIVIINDDVIQLKRTASSISPEWLEAVRSEIQSRSANEDGIGENSFDLIADNLTFSEHFLTDITRVFILLNIILIAISIIIHKKSSQ